MTIENNTMVKSSNSNDVIIDENSNSLKAPKTNNKMVPNNEVNDEETKNKNVNEDDIETKNGQTATSNETNESDTNSSIDDDDVEAEQDIIPDRIFVGNLPYEVTEDDVRNLTPEFNVISVEIPRKNFLNRLTNEYMLQSKGYGFITYTNSTDAKNAIGSIVGKEISGREIYAKYALPQNKNKFKMLNNNGHNNPLSPNFRKQQQPPYYINNGFPPHFIRNGAIAPPPAFFYPPLTPHPQQMPIPLQPQHQLQHPINPIPSPPTHTSSYFNNKLHENNIKPFYPTPIQIPNHLKSKEEKLKRLENGVPSNNTIFIGNLERNVTIDTLRNYLLKFSLNAKLIKIPRKILPNEIYKMLKANNVQIQNKGIAFVQFENNELQLKAIELINGKFWNGKKLNVTVAINAPIDENIDNSTNEAVDNNGAAEGAEYDNDHAATDDEDDDDDDDEIELVVSDDPEAVKVDVNESVKDNE